MIEDKCPTCGKPNTHTHNPEMLKAFQSIDEKNNDKLTYVYTERPFESVIQFFHDNIIIGSASVRDSRLRDILNDKSRDTITFTREDTSD
jgi:hypothetical protein